MRTRSESKWLMMVFSGGFVDMYCWVKWRDIHFFPHVLTDSAPPTPAPAPATAPGTLRTQLLFI